MRTSARISLASASLLSSSQVSNLEADAARTMAWRVVHLNLVAAELNRRHVIEGVHLRLRLHGDAEHRSLLDYSVVQEQVFGVQTDGNVEGFLRRCDAGDVIDMRVRQQDMLHLEVEGADSRNELVHFVARVDHDCLVRALAADNEAVLHEWRNRANLENHGRIIAFMVLCVVDDLLFSVKISTAAKALGVDIYFERSADMVLARAREKQPSLIIFDLNSVRLRPLEMIEALKADPDLKALPTLGYVSHVQTETIAAARKAGVDEVLARSAFVEQLGSILTKDRGARTQ